MSQRAALCGPAPAISVLSPPHNPLPIHFFFWNISWSHGTFFSLEHSVPSLLLVHSNPSPFPPGNISSYLVRKVLWLEGKMYPHKLVYLNAEYSDGGAIWEGYRAFSELNFARRSGSRDDGFVVLQPRPASCSLLASCLWRQGEQQHPAPASLPSPSEENLSPGTQRQKKLSLPYKS